MKLLLILFAGFWLFLAARGVKHDFKRHEKFNWIFALPILVAFFGFAGFFAQAFSAEGIIKLPKSYEWPAGYVSNVVTLADRRYVVPIVPSGRVQLYDSNWQFLRGWNVDALGGDFKVASTSPGAIEVFTARGQYQYTFNENGDLLSSGKFSESFYSLPNEGQSSVVPTSFLLWPFTNPFISVAVGVLGFCGFALIRKFAAKSPTPR